MRRLVILFCLWANVLTAQPFEPIPENLKPAYTFNLKKNFFADDFGFEKSFKNVIASLKELNLLLNRQPKTVNGWLSILRKYNRAEASYRFVDLYLFLRYATNVADEAADKQSDSLINAIRITRAILKDKVAHISASDRMSIISAAPEMDYFINSIVREKAHLLTAEQEKVAAHFQYLKSSTFYDKILSTLEFEKVLIKEGEIDVFREMSAWQNHPDENIRKESELKLFKGYAKQRESFGINYIHFIKGLSAFSKTKNFSSLVDEKLFTYQLPGKTLENMFTEIIKAAKKEKRDFKTPVYQAPPLRFTISEATNIISNVFKVFGSEYHKEITGLLDPQNGRIDIAGGNNRIPIRGTASVYPIYPSVFYAYNYEGYLIDLSLLAHEAGHAVQASLMKNNKVPLMYANGPGYFTESFGKFNELLLFDFLARNEKDAVKKNIYENQLKERLDGLYGSTEEAFIEYSLINGILANKVSNVDDLDSLTYLAGSSVSNKLYTEMPERKNLWMLLETNFRAPLHNINDMIAAALANRYYQMYKTNNKEFIPSYLKLLKEGYHDSPATLLKKVNIDIHDPEFITSVINFTTFSTGKKAP